jgi:TetR/AcrR family acrAB operon transcriptional repressor
MARKTKEEAEKTRYTILNAALAVFNRKGFVRSTMKDIANEAGITRGAIYWHFKDKANLFEALSDDIRSASGIRFEDIPWESFVSLDEVRDFILEYLCKFETDNRFRSFYEVVTYKTEYHEELEPVLAKERTKSRRVKQQLITIFQKFHDKGLMNKNLDPADAAIFVCAFVWGLLEVWLLDKTLFSIKDSAPALTDHIFKSMELNPNV